MVGPLRTPDNDELWRGRRSELRASICADDHSGGQRQSYTLSIYHLVPGDPDVSRQSHLREHELLAFLGSTLKVDRTKLQPDGMGLMLLAAHGLELVAGLKSFQIRENEETEEARHSFEGLTRSEHLAQVSDELYRAGIVSKSQALAAYREMQMLEEAQTATPTYLIGGGVHNLVDVGLRPPPG